MTEWDAILRKNKESKKNHKQTDEEIKERLVLNQIAMSKKMEQLERKLEMERRIGQMQVAMMQQQPQCHPLPPLPQLPLRVQQKPAPVRNGPSGFAKTAGMFSTGRGIRKSWKGVR